MSSKKDERKGFRDWFLEEINKQLEEELGHKVELNPKKRKRIEELANKQLDERENYTIKLDELLRKGGIYLVGEPSIRKVRFQSALIVDELKALAGDEEE